MVLSSWVVFLLKQLKERLFQFFNFLLHFKKHTWLGDQYTPIWFPIKKLGIQIITIIILFVWLFFLVLNEKCTFFCFITKLKLYLWYWTVLDFMSNWISLDFFFFNTAPNGFYWFGLIEVFYFWHFLRLYNSLITNKELCLILPFMHAYCYSV